MTGRALPRPDSAELDPMLQLALDIGSFTHDPLGYALYAFPWGEAGTDLAQHPGPRRWQSEQLATIGAHLQDPATRFQPLRLAVASGHGIGKSALIAIIVKWALDSCADARVVITANTEGQLLTKTSPEIAKWARLALTRSWFRANATSLVATTPGHDKGWRADLVTWSEHNTEAFAGLHNQGKRIVVVYDEASGIAERVWEVTLGALTDEDTEIIWIAFGNPTLNTGAFRECFGKARHLWKTAQIDSRTVEGTNKVYLDELVRTYGEDSDIVKVRVRGMFPSAASMQFIGADIVDAARARVAEALGSDPVIFGVDCARFGDDRSVLAIRCGRDAQSRPWKSWIKQDAMAIAGDVALEAMRWKPDAIFVDAGNIGAAVVDRLRQLGVANVFEVWFGGEGGPAYLDNDVTVHTGNKRTQMWTRMRSWLKGGAIPDIQRLSDDLTGPTYAFGADEVSIVLERKKDMKKRGLASPDDGDALACTFAEPVMPRAVPAYMNPASYAKPADGLGRYDEL
jgi:hypothetical protein